VGRVLLLLAATVLVAVGAGAVWHQARGGSVPGPKGEIAFQSSRDGNAEIYVMDGDGTNQENISQNPAEDFAPAWRADGSQIVFVSDRDRNREIYKMDANGSNQTRLTFNSARDVAPSWTSDNRIVFERGGNLFSSCDVGADIWIMNADGTGEHNITNNPAIDCEPTGSSTGRIGFGSWRDGTGEIYSMDLNGTVVQRITHTRACEVYPNWSPDTAQVVFARDTDPNCNGTDNDLYVSNADGSNEVRLTETPNRIEYNGAWSPAGDLIAFDGCPTGQPCQIYTMNPTGGNEEPLTSVGSNFAPDWQP